MTITADNEDIKLKSVEESIVVNVPLDTAYNEWTQFEEFPKFMSGVDEITQLDDTHNHWRASVGGVKREFDTEIVEQKPDDKIAWKSVDGKTHAGVVSFHRLNADQTKVMLQMDWSPEGGLEKIGSALHLDEQQIRSSLHNFKEYIEGQNVEDGAWRGTVDRADESVLT